MLPVRPLKLRLAFLEVEVLKLFASMPFRHREVDYLDEVPANDLNVSVTRLKVLSTAA